MSFLSGKQREKITANLMFPEYFRVSTEEVEDSIKIPFFSVSGSEVDSLLLYMPFLFFEH